MDPCCLRGAEWAVNEPKGREAKLADLDCYITGSNISIAILLIHDLYGWTFRNSRLLADHYAEEVGATVYLADLYATYTTGFGREVLPTDILLQPDGLSQIDLTSFLKRNTKTIREPEMHKCCKALRQRHKHLGAVGFCFGGWAAFRLGSKTNNLVDCISVAHPSLLTKDEIRDIAVPVQIMAPEIDPMFTPELKAFSLEVLPKLGVPFSYEYFPGLEHAFATRGSRSDPKEMAGMERAEKAAVYWLRQWLTGS